MQVAAIVRAREREALSAACKDRVHCWQLAGGRREPRRWLMLVLAMVAALRVGAGGMAFFERSRAADGAGLVTNSAWSSTAVGG